MSSKTSYEEAPRKIKVAIVGAGISGLALAHGLLNDPGRRFEVCVYERDTVAFDLDRGGYQLRMCAGGIDALRTVTNLDTWNKLQKIWAGDKGRAPAMVDPKTMKTQLELSKVKVYPKSCGVARVDLKYVLIQRLEEEKVVRFSCPFERYELVASETVEGEHQVLLHFQDPQRNPSVRADFVVGADGSNSRFNRQAGINNKAKLGSWTLIQSRGGIDMDTFSKLPPSLVSQGSCIYLAGADYSGFAAVYKQTNVTSTTQGRPDDYQIFWSALIPKNVGDDMVKSAGDDKLRLVDMLSSYVTDVVKYDPRGLPFIYKAALEHVRSGAVTTSRRPDSDWRGGKAAYSRVILVGDAIHPMTPGRGMGANQALMDTGELVNLLRSTHFPPQGPRDEDWKHLTSQFEATMFDRAFSMVKASEDMTSLDLTTTGGKIKITIGKIVLTVIGFVVSALQVFGFCRSQAIHFHHPEEV